MCLCVCVLGGGRGESGMSATQEIARSGLNGLYYALKDTHKGSVNNPYESYSASSY